jgi:hypothetical protein
VIDADERALFAATVERATSTRSGAALDAALDALGWPDALAADARSAVSVLFERQGVANVTSSALDLVLAGALGVCAGRRSGHGPAGVVFPALGGGDPPGELQDGRLTVRGLGTAGLVEREAAVVVAVTGDGPVTVVVDTSALALRPVAGLDPALGLVEVVAEVAVDDLAVDDLAVDGLAVDDLAVDDLAADDVAADDVVPSTRPEPPPVAWTAALAVGRLALAHELVGVARAMLGLAREHALERVQFERPIASFQAVRHRLADALVAVEAADAAVTGAWDAGTPVAAGMAKAVAGRGARTAARHCQQVLAGIGFTTEHAFHRHVRRALVLDQLLGSADRLTRELGEELLRCRRVPAALAL